MVDFLFLVVVGSLIVWGIYATYQKGMIFGGVSHLLDRLPSFARKPLGGCIVCMSSVYGTLIFWSFYFSGVIHYSSPFLFYICFVFAVTGASYIIKNLIYVQILDETEEK